MSYKHVVSAQLNMKLNVVYIVPSCFVYTAACTALYYVAAKHCEHAVSDTWAELTAMQQKDRIEFYTCIH